MLGRRAAFNASHSEADLDRITDIQKAELYPRLRGMLSGDERVVLDLGCGPGRFSADLAEIVAGRTIGLDTTKSLLTLAPASERVEYLHMQEGKIPLRDGSVDVVWIVLVLGGITRRDVLLQTLDETRRVLAPGGFLLLAENTSEKTDTEYWAYRSVGEYIALFSEYELTHEGDYFDLDDRISVLTGREMPVRRAPVHRVVRRAASPVLTASPLA